MLHSDGAGRSRRRKSPVSAGTRGVGSGDGPLMPWLEVMPTESATPRTTKTTRDVVDVLDDEDVRRRVRRGELVPMRATPLTPLNPLVMARLRELAARPLRGRGSGTE